MATTAPEIQRVEHAELRVFKPHNDSDTPNFVIPGDDDEHGIESFAVEPKAQDEIDQGTVQLVNSDGRYGIDEHPITRGDRVEWWAALDDESGWGTLGWGEGVWGDLSHRWTGMVGEADHTRVARDVATLSLDVEEFVFGVLSDRIVYRVFDDEPVHEIIETLVDLKAPELETDLVEVDETTDVVSQGLNLLEIVTSLAKRARCLLFGDGQTLIMRRIDDLESAFTISMDSGDIGTPFDLQTNPDELLNFVRLDGGDANALDEEQDEQSDWELVTDETRIVHRLRPTRSRADRVEVFTRLVGSSDDELRVRIQRDDGGEPVDVESRRSDIVHADRAPSDAGWTALFLDDHSFHDQDPWLIIEATGEDGVEVGINNGGEPTFRTFYRYPIIAENQDVESIEQFRRIERSKTDESIRTFDAAVDEADSVIDQHNRPRKQLQAPALSKRLQTLDIGSMVTLDIPEQEAVGDYLLAGRQDAWSESGNLFTVSVTLQEAASL